MAFLKHATRPSLPSTGFGMTFCEVALGIVSFLLFRVGIILGEIVATVTVAGTSDVFKGTGLETLTKKNRSLMIIEKHLCQLLLRPTSSIDSPVLNIIICLIIGCSHIDTVRETHQKTENCSTMHHSAHYLCTVKYFYSLLL